MIYPPVRISAVAALMPGLPPGSFDPSDLGTSVTNAWFDFSDTGTITESGGAVSQVTDKSGNGNIVAQSSGAAKPTTGAATLNSLNVLTFGGDDALEQSTGLTYPTASGAQMIVLAKHDADTGSGLAWIISNGASNGDVCYLGRDAGNMGSGGDGTNSSVTTVAEYADSDNTNWHVYSAKYTLAAREIWEDGTSMDTDADAVGTAAVTKFVIGLILSRNRGAVRFLTGKIAEVIVLAGTTDLDRQKCEGYLAWKYGIEGQLDGGHPYAGAAP